MPLSPAQHRAHAAAALGMEERPPNEGGAPPPAPLGRLRRLGSALSSAWGSDSSLLRHSSITNVVPTGIWQAGGAQCIWQTNNSQVYLLRLSEVQGAAHLLCLIACMAPTNRQLPLSVPTRFAARWYEAMFMLVCADGAPFLLGLPAAMTRLGWPGGLAVLLAGFLCILHAATRIVMLHEHGGKRHNRYRELAQAVLGGCLERGGMQVGVQVS